jgi:hypothetical protein
MGPIGKKTQNLQVPCLLSLTLGYLDVDERRSPDPRVLLKYCIQCCKQETPKANTQISDSLYTVIPQNDTIFTLGLEGPIAKN